MHSHDAVSKTSIWVQAAQHMSLPARLHILFQGALEQLYQTCYDPNANCAGHHMSIKFALLTSVFMIAPVFANDSTTKPACPDSAGAKQKAKYDRGFCNAVTSITTAYLRPIYERKFALKTLDLNCRGITAKTPDRYEVNVRASGKRDNGPDFDEHYLFLFEKLNLKNSVTVSLLCVTGPDGKVQYLKSPTTTIKKIIVPPAKTTSI